MFKLNDRVIVEHAGIVVGGKIDRISSGIFPYKVLLDRETFGVYHLWCMESYLKEDNKSVQQITPLKIKIKDAQHSANVQDVLFKMGYKWCGGTTYYNHHEFMKVIYVDSNGRMTYDVDLSLFHSEFRTDHIEFELKETIQYTLEKKEIEIVEFMGKKYDKDQVEEILKQINPVE